MNVIRKININNAVVIVDFSKNGQSATEVSSLEMVQFGDFLKHRIKNLRDRIIRFAKITLRLSPVFELIPPTDAFSMRGAGIKYKSKEYITHSTLPYSLSAVRTFTFSQKLVLVFVLILALFGFLISPLLTFQVIVTVLSLMYFSDVVFNLIVVIRSLHSSDEITFSANELDSINESKLPTYTILCPLYKESHILQQFIGAINDLDYPKEKLDVILLLEKDDKETVKILDSINLPSYIRKLIVPPSLPKTKPKACNYGLSFAKGEFLVIYDAEDIPDPQQLKKAYIGFRKLPKDVQCLQAKLNYYNPRVNILTRFFTVEYALWFDIMLTGLQSFNSTLPLGGTSNHFKTAKLKSLRGWDPFNVTEDADLGVRLFQKGYRTAVMDSVTHEEAASEFKNWIRQRSRWLKGYMQTYFVHTRNYRDFIYQKGIIHYIIFQLTVGGKILFILINPLMWIITALYFAAYALAGSFLESIYQPPVSYIAVTSWIFGNFLFIYYYMIATGRKKEWDLMKYVFFIPIYWGMMSMAGMIALYQLILKPHYWEKTVHGVHLADKYKKYSLENKIAIHPAFQLIFTRLNQVISSIRINILSVYSLLTTYFPEKSLIRRNHILIYNWRDTKHVYAGGAEVYIQELAKRWVKEGSRVTIFSSNDSKSLLNEKIDGVDIIRRGGVYTVYVFGFLYYLFKFRGKVDLIVDCENGIPFFTPLYARVPVILLIHHVHQEIFREFLMLPLRHVAAFLEGKVMPLVYKDKQIVTVSNSSMKEIIKLGFTTSRNIKIVQNGVNVSPDVSYVKTQHPSLLYVGRLKDYKNIDIAIKAFAKILTEHNNAIFSIVGSGESYIRLKKLVKKLKIEKSVEFLGRITEEEKIKQFSQSWIMVQPSLVEGWGITVIEANSYRTPVVASRVNGLIDSVVENKTGILVDSKNIEQYSKAISRLFKDKNYRNKLSENAYKWSQNFNWEKSAFEFQSLIRGCIREDVERRALHAGLSIPRTEKELSSI